MKKLPTLQELEFISKHSGIGASKSRLAQWGVSWPPPNGWLKKLKREILEVQGQHIVTVNPTIQERKQKAAKVRKIAPQKRKSFTSNPTDKAAFYASWEWKKIRMEALLRDGHRCGSCGSTPQDGIRLVVDHIKPLGKAWSLRLSLDNLQVLCNDCNMGKGDWLEKDFRVTDEWEEPEVDYMTAQYKEMMRH